MLPFFAFDHVCVMYVNFFVVLLLYVCCMRRLRVMCVWCVRLVCRL